MDPKNHAAMLEALRRKKAHGVDLTVMIGHPGEHPMAHNGDAHGDGEGDASHDEETEQKELGLAPEAEEVGESADEKARELAMEGHEGNHVPGEEIINHPGDEEEGHGLMAGHLSGHGQLGRSSMHHRMMKKKHLMGGK